MGRIVSLMAMALAFSASLPVFAERRLCVANRDGVGVLSKEAFDIVRTARADQEVMKQVAMRLILSGEVYIFRKGDKFIELEAGGGFRGLPSKVRPAKDLDISMYVNRDHYDPVSP